MTREQVALIKENWAIVAPHAEEAGNVFYHHLFNMAPGVRSLFPTDMKEQQRKLIATLGYVVHHAHQLDTIADQVKQLGARHNNYGAQPHHYEVVAVALLQCLQQVSANNWDAETEDAWRTAFNTLRNIMIVAQEDARMSNESKLAAI